MTNYAAPGAHVGLQVDGDVTITGDLFVGMGDSRPAAGDGGDGEATWVQEGPRNVASGNDTVGVQAGQAGEPS